MKKIAPVFILIVLIAVVWQVNRDRSAAVGTVDIGPDLRRRFHITGCENGELVVPEVNLWSGPGGLTAGARVMGTLSGTSAEDSCQGAVVVEEERHEALGRVFFKVTDVVSGRSGWLTDSFVGFVFDADTCADVFAGNAAAIERCER